ncbi:class I SAM-dependent methyltransferase [Patescibacteria group bacterium]
MKSPLYDQKLANEWIDWVEADDPSSSRKKEIYPLITKWAKDNQSKSVVDIGCGQGICSKFIDKKIKYIGIDQSDVLIKRANKLYSSQIRKFIVGNAYNISLEDNCCDAIISIWVWSHLDSLDRAASEMYRILKPGGKFLIITANPKTYDIRMSFYESYKEYEDYLVGTFNLGKGKRLTNTILYFHTLDNMKNAIVNSGLIIDNLDTIGLKETYKDGLYVLIRGNKPIK